MSDGTTITTEPASLERSDKTGLTDSTHTSSSSASEKYRLDEFDAAPILLYTYRGGLKTSSQKEICAWLNKGMSPAPHSADHHATLASLTYCDVGKNIERHRVTKKPIPRYTSYVDVKRHDLYLPEEKPMYASFPNYDSSLASIKIPSIPYWSRMLLGNYSELFIVSPESSPSSSIADDDSRRASPTAAWGSSSELGARLGALQERREREEA
jgi:hypothetical protein